MTRSSLPGLAIALTVLAAGLIIAFTVGRYPVSFAELIEVLWARALGRPTSAPAAVENVVLLVRGPRVLAAVLVWARERGLNRVSLWAPASEPAAVALYSGAGFKDTGRQRPLPTNAELRIIEMEIDL